MFIKLKKYITNILKSIEEYPFFFYYFFQIIFFIWFYKIPLLHNYIYKLTKPINNYKEIVTTIASFDGILFSLFFTEFLSKYKEIGQIFSNNKYVMKKIRACIFKHTLPILVNFAIAVFCLYNYDENLCITKNHKFDKSLHITKDYEFNQNLKFQKDYKYNENLYITEDYKCYEKSYVKKEYILILIFNFISLIIFYYFNLEIMNKMYSTKYFIKDLKENIYEYF